MHPCIIETWTFAAPELVKRDLWRPWPSKKHPHIFEKYTTAAQIADSLASKRNIVRIVPAPIAAP